MLENLRKQGASAFIWIVFAILIGMFVVNFGQQSAGARGGCHLGSGKTTALTVGKEEIDETGLRLAVNLGQILERRQGGDNDSQARRAMERLIVRELLAGEAERRGLRVPDSLVDDAITHGRIHFSGQVVNASGLFFAKVGAEDGKDDEAAEPKPSDTYFEYKQFKNFLRRMGISVGAYKRDQTREILASTMARILMHSVPASKDEALAQYISENTRVSFNTVRFDANKYADALLITDEDVDRFIKGHSAEVKQAYDPAAYKGKKQFHVRRIFLARAPLPPAPNPTPQPANGGTGPAPIPPPPPDPARAKLETLRAAIAAGKRGFSEVASETDGDPKFAARGGDWGWYDDGAPTLSDPALNTAVAGLVPGKVSEVIATSDGFYLLIIDDRREGDLTIDKVQREVALPLARAAWGKEAARRAAIKALTEARLSGKHLGELYPAGKTGLLEPGPTTIISDRPVMWGQAGDGSAAPAAPTAPTAEAPAAPAAPATPATGAAGAPAVPPAPPGPPPIMVPSNEALPTMGKLETPAVERHDGIVRAGDATPLGTSRELARALFDELAAGATADRIYEVRASEIDPMPQYVLIEMTAKELADVAAFEKQADRLVDRLAMTRGYQLFGAWLRDRCTTMARAGKLRPTARFLQTFDDQGRKLPITYQPCESLAQK